jgi:hypothetical protein
MKKILVLLSLLAFADFSYAQKNLIKTNLFSLALNNYNLTYERAITKKISISASYRTMPKGNAPLKKYIEDYVDRNDFEINSFKLGNTALTLESRFYLGRKTLNGFYLSPYLRYTDYSFDFPITHPQNITSGGAVNNPPILLSGNIQALCGGFMMGVQTNLSKKIVMDVTIIGAHFGKSSGVLRATNISPALTGTDIAEFESTINDYQQVGPFKFVGTVYKEGTGADQKVTGAEQKASGPWIGLRTLSFSLGYRF